MEAKVLKLLQGKVEVITPKLLVDQAGEFKVYDVMTDDILSFSLNNVKIAFPVDSERILIVNKIDPTGSNNFGFSLVNIANYSTEVVHPPTKNQQYSYRLGIPFDYPLVGLVNYTGKLHIWNLETKRLIKQFKIAEEWEVRYIKLFFSKGIIIVIEGKVFNGYQIVSGKIVFTSPLSYPNNFTSLTFLPNFQFATGDDKSCITIFSYPKGKAGKTGIPVAIQEKKIDLLRLQSTITTLTYIKDEKVVFATYNSQIFDFGFRVIDLKTEKLLYSDIGGLDHGKKIFYFPSLSLKPKFSFEPPVILAKKKNWNLILALGNSSRRYYIDNTVYPGFNDHYDKRIEKLARIEDAFSFPYTDNFDKRVLRCLILKRFKSALPKDLLFDLISFLDLNNDR